MSLPVSAVAIRGAGKTYANGTQALLPLDLDIAGGEFVSLLGPSGCGKSTLLQMVAGLSAPSVGSVDADRGAIGYVFQDATLMPWARVAANVRLPLDLARVPRVDADARVTAALRLVGLERYAGALPRELSGGMQMRVSIARSLVTRPRLLLMDEPFGALDEITRNRLDGELLALWAAQRLTVLFVTHSISEAVFLSQRVVVMAARPGRVVDTVAIDAPYPRTPSFRVSTAFAGHAGRLQDSLLLASTDTGGEAAAA